MADEIKLQELYEQRKQLSDDMEAILNKADEEKRELTSEETEQYNKMDSDFDKLTETIEVEVKRQKDADALREKREKRKELLSQPQHEPIRPDPNPSNPSDPPKEDRSWVPEKYRAVFDAYNQETGGRFATRDYNKAFNSFLVDGLDAPEVRALQADSAPSGGYLVAPEQFVAKLIQGLDDQVFMRQLATIIQVPDAESLGAPALDNDMGAFAWGSEINEPGQDTSLKFDKRDLFPHPMTGAIKVSEKLIRVSRLNVDSIVRQRINYRAAHLEESAYMQGTGGNQPLGVFTAHAAGISTGQDVSTGNTSSEVKADGLINAKYNLKPQYMSSPSLRWIFHRDLIKMIRKLKTGDGDYIWRAGIATDRPDTILDVPYIMSEFAPNTISASEYVGIIGDFSWYWIADSLNIQIKVLTELYAATFQIGYRVKKETDGMPVLEEAFTRVKLGS